MSKSINNGAIEKKRAVSLDLARGTMLLLIVLAHAPLYLYAADPGIMHRVESGSFFDQIVNFFGIFIIDNRARAMFAVLLGYGLVLALEGQISKGKNENHAVKIVRRRSLYLIL
nr:glyoxalase [Bacillus pacificus]